LESWNLFNLELQIEIHNFRERYKPTSGLKMHSGLGDADPVSGALDRRLV
jgi:hypothetical protein